jgi:twitching motility protein PilT
LAAEVLRVTTSVGSAIREGKMGAMRSAMQSGRADGMITLERSLADLVRRRAISLDVARRTATDPSTLDNYLREGG